MNPNDPNVQRVEVVAQALGSLCHAVVLVGGCAASLLIDSPTAAPARVTYDVDLIVEVAALQGYYAVEKQFAALGFARDLAQDAPVCRWRVGGVAVDLMPTDEAVLGFSNRWYGEAAASALAITLPSGQPINLISSPAFLGTKFEAFETRGNSDILSSHDLEDIINLVDGRRELLAEVAAAQPGLRAYLANRFQGLQQHTDFDNALPGLVAFDALYQHRLKNLRSRIAVIAQHAPLGAENKATP